MSSGTKFLKDIKERTQKPRICARGALLPWKIDFYLEMFRKRDMSVYILLQKLSRKRQHKTVTFKRRKNKTVENANGFIPYTMKLLHLSKQ